MTRLYSDAQILVYFFQQRILEAEIEGFLLRTARWTSQWFNKPKFHTFLHISVALALLSSSQQKLLNLSMP